MSKVSNGAHVHEMREFRIPRPSSGARGKLKGAINIQYRDTMWQVVASGNHYLTPDLWAVVSMGDMLGLMASHYLTPGLWAVASRECGYEVSAKAVKDWLYRGGGATAGYVERQDDSYHVSQLAIDEFCLAKPGQQSAADMFSEPQEAAQ